MVILIGMLFSLNGKDFSREKIRLLVNARKLGPLYFTPYFIIKEIGYDFNIYQLEKEQEGDWFANAGIGGRASFIRPRYFLSVVYTPSYLYYLHHKDENFFNYDFSSEGMLQLGKLHFYANYFKGKQRIRPTYEFGPRVRVLTEGENFSIELGPGRLLSFELLGNSTRYRYMDEKYLDYYNLSRLDRRENTLSFRIKRKIFSATRFYIEAGYREILFFRKEPGKDVNQFWASIGFLFPEIGFVTGSFNVGYKEIFSRDSKESLFKGMIGNGNLRFRIKRLELILLYSLGWNYSFWTYNLLRIENYGGKLSFYLTRNIKLGGGYTQGTLKFKEINRTDHIKRYEAYLLFRISGNTGVGIAYYLYRARSNIYDWNRYTSYIGGTITNVF